MSMNEKVESEDKEKGFLESYISIISVAPETNIEMNIYGIATDEDEEISKRWWEFWK